MPRATAARIIAVGTKNQTIILVRKLLVSNPVNQTLTVRNALNNPTSPAGYGECVTYCR